MRFLIQEFSAQSGPSRYYLRLEKDGVFQSWAVPKGMPKKEKNHLALAVGPLQIRDGGYAGMVKKGKFGPGNISIWDQGDYRPHFWSGEKIIIELSGSRVKGGFALVRFPKAGPKHWLLGVTPIERPASTASRQRRGVKRAGSKKKSVSRRRKEWPDTGCHEIDTSRRPGETSRLKKIFRINKSSLRTGYGAKDWLLLLGLVIFGLAVLAIVTVLRYR
jgi:DNA ligase D-like protein (predicted 3'-phosphoesterase)